MSRKTGKPSLIDAQRARRVQLTRRFRKFARRYQGTETATRRPLSSRQRARHYAAQSGRITPRQVRRMRHKSNRMEGAQQ